MFNHKSTKTAIVLAVAVLMVAVVLLSSCTNNPFKPVTMPEQGEVGSNGGNAVRYGDWIYYVNGYQSSANAENTYENVVARTGAIARIKIADLEDLFEVYNDSKFTTSSARTTEIARLVEENAEIVIPNIYYSGNTTTTNINGIYIFDDRIYIQTPNDELTAGGNSQTSQSVLTSYKLDGSDRTRHYVFTSNSAQVMLNKVEGKLVATYIMGAEVGCVDVKNGTKIASVEETSNAQIDVAGKAAVYLKDKAVCKLNAGASEPVTLVANEKDSTITYTIVTVNDGYVHYTVKDDKNTSVADTVIYYVTEATASKAESERVALSAKAPGSNYYGYKENIVRVKSKDIQGTTLYGIYVVVGDDVEGKMIVSPEHNSSSITFNRIEGDTLYYTANSIAYRVDLSAAEPAPIAYGKSLSSASGWSVPDVVDLDSAKRNYVISLGAGSVSVVEFDSDKKDNTLASPITLTVVEPKTDEDK